jgi:hypothetical protein
MITIDCFSGGQLDNLTVLYLLIDVVVLDELVLCQIILDFFNVSVRIRIEANCLSSPKVSNIHKNDGSRSHSSQI